MITEQDIAKRINSLLRPTGAAIERVVVERNDTFNVISMKFFFRHSGIQRDSATCEFHYHSLEKDELGTNLTNACIKVQTAMAAVLNSQIAEEDKEDAIVYTSKRERFFKRRITKY